MAYTATPAYSERSVSGRRHVAITLTETDCAAASETSVDVPVRGTIVLYKATKTAGAGSTIDPVFGTASGFTTSTQAHVGSNDTAAAFVNNAIAIPYYSSTGKLYIRSTPDSGSNNAISTQILIVEGWM